ncbi:MAG: methylenetetrahydrofolate reductase C-terminal domain-containing protein [Kiritimatiellia bacterium]|jgi:methylenetetrahydrofolate reductase (NADPH)|nr:methylenetetrahydrofolate reductase C-terminal domain-containing protein [Kiritimatiellia bacterium]MDP6630340.1 methylenetetrahydrofolate reductase C-terminal domain-containing protein [Kiritimatiellia bacterium]MDP6810846.1 methylenetetrahydrofolate reductase C-terminal domain-containing protein [Kiritimatiellia bacterium]MDP7024189.1 methylenetetrahydrofolate reductase C-terminal domain-containing protein [Kiritimatiellia bacterium]
MTDQENRTTFREMLTGETFHYGVELVSSRGLPRPDGVDGKLLHEAEELAQNPHFSWISVTDNPGGNPMLPADWLGHRITELGKEVVIHLSCKDLNRNGLESAAWRSASEGFNNILALTGDHPVSGYGGNASPVFDLDSVGLISLLKAMNDGLEIPARRGGTEALPPADFFVGCAVSPFKKHEREYLPQLFKLAKKVQCGAQWVVPQLGYDMRKFQELQLFCRWAGLDVPLIGNVYLLSKFVAKMFNRNDIPGCVVSNKLLELVEKYAAGPDKGRAFFRELAAKQLAIFKGLGYDAGYIAGVAKPETFAGIIQQSKGFGVDDWKIFAQELQFPVEDEFYLWEQDPETKLSDYSRMNREYLDSLLHPKSTRNVSASYRMSRMVHSAAFTREKGLYNLMKKLYGAIDGEGAAKTATSKVMHGIEHVSKQMMFRCKDCGDCSLADCAYLCPRSACSKNTRNGPCGGSYDGQCELDDKQCIWARAYDRTKYYGESQAMLDGPTVIYNPNLEGTSAWANTYLDRDHHAPREGEQSAPLLPDPKPAKGSGH